MKIFLQAARPLAADLAATLVFAAVAGATHSARAAAALALATGLGQLGWAWRMRRRVGALQWVSLGLVAVFGAATLVTHDARFMMIKPTVIYAVVAAAMLERGWMIRYLPAAALGRVPEALVVRWGYGWAGLMAATAVLNAAVALAAGFAVWALFVGVFPLASKLALFAVQYAHMRLAAARRAAPVAAAA
jgi:intracellular septation protein A